MSEVISHEERQGNLEAELAAIRTCIAAEGDKSYVSVDQSLKLLNELAEFPLGRFLILNKGMDGYWTQYVCEYPETGRIKGRDRDGRAFSSMEEFLLNERPMGLATQQRYKIFKNLLQQEIREGASLASLPSGVMGDLLTLNYENIHDIKLTAIDLDPASLAGARKMAEEKGISAFVETIHRNAWDINLTEVFTAISSSGFSIYIDKDEDLLQLYKVFHRALKPSGTLITSFFTPPPNHMKKCEWNMNAVDPNALMKQKIIYGDILKFKGSCYRTSSETQSLLALAGFERISFHQDQANIFPTVQCYKPAA